MYSYYTYTVRSNQDWSVPAIEQLWPIFLIGPFPFPASSSCRGFPPWSHPAWAPICRGGTLRQPSFRGWLMVNLYIVRFSDPILWWQYSILHTISVTNACCIYWVWVSCSAGCCFVFMTVCRKLVVGALSWCLFAAVSRSWYAGNEKEDGTKSR